MDAKLKAQELVDKYYLPNITWALLHAKQCALIAVDEILLSQFQFDMISIYRTPFNHYWQEVKQEIEKL
jgi:hypothetical protein